MTDFLEELLKQQEDEDDGEDFPSRRPRIRTQETQGQDDPLHVSQTVSKSLNEEDETARKESVLEQQLFHIKQRIDTSFLPPATSSGSDDYVEAAPHESLNRTENTSYGSLNRTENAPYGNLNRTENTPYETLTDHEALPAVFLHAASSRTNPEAKRYAASKFPLLNQVKRTYSAARAWQTRIVRTSGQSSVISGHSNILPYSPAKQEIIHQRYAAMVDTAFARDARRYDGPLRIL